MAEQLAFDLPARPALGRGDFFVSDGNARALAALDGWRGWPGGRFLLLGPPGAGKTHLAHVWAADTGARVIGPGALGPADVPRLAVLPALAIDGADRGVDEQSLFHLMNFMAAEGGALLLTATRPPAAWHLGLPDLESRLSAVSAITLPPPDDALLQAVLVKLFADRQLAVTPALIRYLIPRIERSFEAARTVVAQLDAAALAENAPVSRALAARVLDKEGRGGA